MADTCTCGAQLPPDARFCHKCGKPQRDEPLLVPNVERHAVPFPPAGGPVEPPLRLPSALTIAPKPAFHNPVALRAALAAASVATLLNMFLGLLFFIWLLGAGFLSVYLFSRRSGASLSVRGGARMGWITGVLAFVIITVLMTVSVLTNGSGFAELYRQQIASMPVEDPNVAQAVKMLESPSGVAMVFATSLTFLFGVFTALSTAGGALGAKVLEKE